MITPFNEDFSFLALLYCAHHSPPEGVGIAGEVRLAPWALRVLLRQVDEVAERAKFDDQKMIPLSSNLEKMSPKKPM